MGPPIVCVTRPLDFARIVSPGLLQPLSELPPLVRAPAFSRLQGSNLFNRPMLETGLWDAVVYLP